MLVAKSTIRFATFPRTIPPQDFLQEVVLLFKRHEATISTVSLDKGLTSDEVLAVMAHDFASLGFMVETSKAKVDKIERPVFFGENGSPTLNYQIDAYHPSWKCGLEIEAGRAWMGNAVYRDLIQASVMVGVEHLLLAVPNTYKFKSSGRTTISRDYENTRDLAEAIYGHSRVSLPYRLVVIGY
jgi:hypothetical protein